MDGLTSFIVSYDYNDTDADIADLPDDDLYMQFWAEDAGHAGSQFDDAEPDARVLLIETAAEFEARTGIRVDA